MLMRKIFAIAITTCLIYFLGGWVAVYYDVVKRQTYLDYAGIVGSLASVAGLIAFIKPAFSKSDINATELDALKSMTEKLVQLQLLEAERSKTKEEIESLEIKKQEMELLVKKASLALFLKEQYEYHSIQITDEIERNASLKEHLKKASEAANKLEVLGEEIAASPNVDQLREIIDSAKREPISTDYVMRHLPYPIDSVYRLSLEISRIGTNLAQFFK